ncbi:AbrB/MazE/SpoVT family DNA-binding domain-containing protein [Novosphingobium sp. MMS21-SN21R]|uniref:AbrB/MazE/SpoVT family DNA-binding domain-containing protein n=1 Tax=Novosphingobium sp. MMS21-SN21R TaxID=2969298 RepID=UPI002887357A|nr:AbrB/MazE/SpoVT family DNA-binding domain-containing protein [Novosphingobium sp. MMS21-SN21R]MDT0507600.1 AbrB/MazE/SpoVT family DNA-binding domain-containing protein [Novosphingobium sp. MMS21-SN21R]
MSEEFRGKVFRSGNSVALRLPKGLGIAEGTEVRMVKEEHAGFRVEPVEQPKRKIDVSGFAGKAPWLKPLPPELREFDERPSAGAARKRLEDERREAGR